MSCSECILNKDISEFRKFTCKIMIILFFFCTESDILDQHYITRCKLTCCLFDIIVNNHVRRNEFYFLAQILAESCSNRCEAHFRIRFSLRTSEV